eukprot:Tbor_TRINITY_DN8369_c0_g1::TRINITY_DN8369_c0_g1_i1::g.21101::m.21101
MPFYGGIVVRVSDRCILTETVSDEDIKDIWGELSNRCSTPNFRTTYMVQLPSSPKKVAVHILTDITTGYAIVSDDHTNRRSGHYVLDEVAKTFVKMFPEGVVPLSPLTTEPFQKPFAEMLAKYSKEGAIDDKAKKVRKTVEEVKELVLENVERVLERGTKIDDIVSQTDSLSQSAQGFQRSSRQLRNAMWWNGIKGKLIIGGVVVIFLFVLYLVFCAGGTCSKSTPKS